MHTDVVCAALDTLPDGVATAVDTPKTRLRMKFWVPKTCFYRFSAASVL